MPLSISQCLDYFRAIVFSPRDAEPWDPWWAANSTAVQQLFGRPDCLKLKYRKFVAAHEVLISRGICDDSEISYWSPKHGEMVCKVCGADLFWATPGTTTREEFIAHAARCGRDWQSDSELWIHPGVYCPNRCVRIMYNYTRSQDSGSPSQS